jgi:hypothetical protein
MKNIDKLLAGLAQHEITAEAIPHQTLAPILYDVYERTQKFKDFLVAINLQSGLFFTPN